jgi:hypothetical protein
VLEAVLKVKGRAVSSLLVVKNKKRELLLSQQRKGEFNSELYGGCPDCYERKFIASTMRHARQKLK